MAICCCCCVRNGKECNKTWDMYLCMYECMFRCIRANSGKLLASNFEFQVSFVLLYFLCHFPLFSFCFPFTQFMVRNCCFQWKFALELLFFLFSVFSVGCKRIEPCDTFLGDMQHGAKFSKLNFLYACNSWIHLFLRTQ